MINERQLCFACSSFPFAFFESFLLVSSHITQLFCYVACCCYRSYICAGDSFDNIYIEKSFVRLDRRRYDATGNRLLPLRKHERRHLVDARSVRMSPPECRFLVSGLCVVALCLACSVACCTFDHALYWVLSSAEDSVGFGVSSSSSKDVSPDSVGVRHRSQIHQPDEAVDIDAQDDADKPLDDDAVFQQLQQQRHRRHGTGPDSKADHVDRSSRSNTPHRQVVDSGFSGPHVGQSRPSAAAVDDKRRQRTSNVAGGRRSAGADDIVTGDGVVVDLFEVFVRGFRSDEARHLSTSPSAAAENAKTAVCIPMATAPSSVVLLVLGVTHLLFAATVAFKAYAFRARPSIAGYFYTERSAERAVHLYSVLVRRRRRLPSLLRRLAFVGRRRLLQAITDGAVAGGRCAALLRRCDAADVRCVVCWDRDCGGGSSSCVKWKSQGTAGSPSSASAVVSSSSSGVGGKFRHCPCGAVYCPECFVDVGRSCPLCRHDNSGGGGGGSGANDYMSNEDDDDETDDYDDFDECLSFDDDLNDITHYDVIGGTLTHRRVEL